jgi:hypothetical protein
MQAFNAVRDVKNGILGRTPPSGNAPFSSPERMEKALTGRKWHVAFTTHPKYYDGAAFLPWMSFGRTDVVGNWSVKEGYLARSNDGKVTGTKEFDGACSMQGDPVRPWDFQMKQSGMMNMLSKPSRWRIVDFDEAGGVMAVCYDKTFDLQDKPSCHVLVDNLNRHVMREKDKEDPLIRSAMDAIRRQHNFKEMGSDIRPAAGTPYVKVQPYMV